VRGVVWRILWYSISSGGLNRKIAFLYDRALHSYVQMMFKKAFQQLMTDFRRVGSNVIYANRLILQTSKVDVGNAYAYAK